MERCDVFVIGGGGTGSDITGSLAGEGLSVVMAERDLLGGECANYGCDPTKAMLKSARVAALARRAGDYGVRVPSVEVDFDAVMERVRRLIDASGRQFDPAIVDVFIPIAEKEVLNVFAASGTASRAAL